MDAAGMLSRRLKYLRALLVVALILPTINVTLQSSPVLMISSIAPLTDDLVQRNEVHQNDVSYPLNLPMTSDADYAPPPASGVLDPVQVEQSGYSTTGNISARTDSMINTEQNLTIDTTHDWVASTVNVDLWNLRKMYAENGTFKEGYPGVNINPAGSVAYHPLGWDATSTTGDTAQTQLASYSLGSESYLIVENQGTSMPPPSTPTYRHSEGTTISWIQNAVNSPYSEDFILRFRYFYFRGPIGSVPSGNCSIVVYIDGSLEWKTSLLVAGQRGVWIDSGDIIVSRPGIGSSFEIGIGLSIDGTMTLNPNADYDGDTYLDGLQNTFYITAFLDDVSLISTSSPSCEEVGLEFSINGSTSQITGTL